MEFIFGMVVLFLLLPFFAATGTWIADQRTKRRQMEMEHQERMAALEKGVPLPELRSLDVAAQMSRGGRRLQTPLLLGIVFLCAGVGAILALLLISDHEISRFWPLPLPLALVGAGLLLFHFLSFERGN